MQIKVGCEFRYEATWPTPAVMQVQPHQAADQRILHEAWQLTPPLALHSYVDLYGNTCQRIVIPPGNQVLNYDATIEVSESADEDAPDAVQLPVEALPDDVLLYTLPSRFCLSDVLSDMAWQLFGTMEPGWARVQAICDWVHSNIRFQYGSSNSLTTAAEVCAQGVGVCRDFAHASISLLRALNYPARIVTGVDYGADPGLGPPDFHCYLDVFLGDRWYLFDPTGICPLTGLIRIATGTDAADVSFATTFGQVRGTMPKLSFNAVEDGAGISLPYPTTLAISTASVL